MALLFLVSFLLFSSLPQEANCALQCDPLGGEGLLTHKTVPSTCLSHSLLFCDP